MSERPYEPSLNCSIAACTISRKRRPTSPGSSASAIIRRIALTWPPSGSAGTSAMAGSVQPDTLRPSARNISSVPPTMPSPRMRSRYCCSSAPSFACSEASSTASATSALRPAASRLGGRRLGRAAPRPRGPGSATCSSRCSSSGRRPRPCTIAESTRGAASAACCALAAATRATGSGAPDWRWTISTLEASAWRDSSSRESPSASCSRPSSGQASSRIGPSARRYASSSAAPISSKSPIMWILRAEWNSSSPSARAPPWTSTCRTHQFTICWAAKAGGSRIRKLRASKTMSGASLSDRYSPNTWSASWSSAGSGRAASSLTGWPPAGAATRS